jgi:hypothetical protein
MFSASSWFDIHSMVEVVVGCSALADIGAMSEMQQHAAAQPLMATIVRAQP